MSDRKNEAFERLFGQFGLNRQNDPKQLPGESDFAYRQRLKAHRDTQAFLEKVRDK